MNGRTTRGAGVTAAALGLLLAWSAPLAAQGFGGGRPGGPGRGVRAALGALDLSDAQKEKVKTLFQAEKAKMDAMRQEGRAAREALKAASEAANPDPAAVGAAFLRLKAHRQTAMTERKAMRDKVEALLTPEQRAKLDGWRTAHRQMRRARFGAPPATN